MDKTGPKMGFRSPKGGKKCQKWIERVQKGIFGGQRAVKSAQNR